MIVNAQGRCGLSTYIIFDEFTVDQEIAQLVLNDRHAKARVSKKEGSHFHKLNAIIKVVSNLHGLGPRRTLRLIVKLYHAFLLKEVLGLFAVLLDLFFDTCRLLLDSHVDEVVVLFLFGVSLAALACLGRIFHVRVKDCLFNKNVLGCVR